MFTDIVGYTTIVSEDEARARRTRAALSSALGDILTSRGGTLVQSFGDGTLSVFSSAGEAALAASEIQARSSHEAGVDLRIGLHLGEISWDAEGAYGDAVNVAARLQAIGTPGSVLLSEEVSRQLKNRRDVPCVELGQVRLKNVEDPVRVFALALAGLRQPGLAEVARRAREGGGGGTTDHEMMPRSLAVLPLANFSHEPSQEYFVDGMHDASISPRPRARRHRYRAVELIDEEAWLGGTIPSAEGVRRRGSSVRITASLALRDGSSAHHAIRKT